RRVASCTLHAQRLPLFQTAGVKPPADPAVGAVFGVFQPRHGARYPRTENNASCTPTRQPGRLLFGVKGSPYHTEKFTETTPSAEALPPPRQRNRHARRLMPPGVVEVEVKRSRSRSARQVEAVEARPPPPPRPRCVGATWHRSSRDRDIQLANLRCLGAPRRALKRPAKSMVVVGQLSKERHSST